MKPYRRVTDSHRHLHSVGRWGGHGKPPYGYRVVKNGGDGCRLDIDLVKAKVVRRIVADVLDGVPLSRVCRQLETEGIPPPRHKPGGSTRWSQSATRNILRNRAMLGEYKRGDLGPDGKAIKVGPELIDLETYQRLQAALDSASKGVGVRRDASPLSGLVKCAECGSSLWFDTKIVRGGKQYTYYRANRECEHPVTMQAEFLEQAAETTLLHFYGDKEIQDRQWVAGEDTVTALADAVRRFEALAEQLGGSNDSPTARGCPTAPARRRYRRDERARGQASDRGGTGRRLARA